MKAFVLDGYGKKRALRLAEIPDPELRDDEVLVQVHATGVNLLDSKIRDGEFKPILPYRMPLILGHDVAGVRSMPGPMTSGLEPSPNSFRSRRHRWQPSPRASRWMRPPPFLWWD